MAWSQKELEELYRKVNEKGSTDAEFRDWLIRDPVAAMESIAGRPLADGGRLECIANDGGYSNTYVIPDFAQDEMNFDELRNIAGGSRVESSADIRSSGSGEERPAGLSVAGIVSVCAAAVGVGPCGGDACAAQGGCAGDVCGGAVCAAEGGCAGEICGADGCAVLGGCAGNICGVDGCGIDAACAGNVCSGNVCNTNGACTHDACGGNTCSVNAYCADQACGANICGGNAACRNFECGAAASGAVGSSDPGFDPFGQSVANAAPAGYFGSGQVYGGGAPQDLGGIMPDTSIPSLGGEPVSGDATGAPASSVDF